jgi:hypothetical protein
VANLQHSPMSVTLQTVPGSWSLWFYFLLSVSLFSARPTVLYRLSPHVTPKSRESALSVCLPKLGVRQTDAGRSQAFGLTIRLRVRPGKGSGHSTTLEILDVPALGDQSIRLRPRERESGLALHVVFSKLQFLSQPC